MLEAPGLRWYARYSARCGGNNRSKSQFRCNNLFRRPLSVKIPNSNVVRQTNAEYTRLPPSDWSMAPLVRLARNLMCDVYRRPQKFKSTFEFHNGLGNLLQVWFGGNVKKPHVFWHHDRESVLIQKICHFFQSRALAVYISFLLVDTKSSIFFPESPLKTNWNGEASKNCFGFVGCGLESIINWPRDTSNSAYFSIDRKIGVFLKNSDAVVIAIPKAIKSLYILMVWGQASTSPEEQAKCWKFFQKEHRHPVYWYSLYALELVSVADIWAACGTNSNIRVPLYSTNT